MTVINVKERKRQDRSFLDLDQTTLKPDRHYRWVRVSKEEHMMQVTKHKLRNYQLETKKGGVKTLAETDNRPDDVIAIGDLVLMSCPKLDHEQRVRDRQSRTEALLASTSAETERMAKEKGISIIKDADHGSQT
jgi:hypothetical protein